MKRFLTPTAIWLFAAISVQAGTLSSTDWKPTGCGEKVPAPVVNTKSVDDYNKSIKDINAWQKKAQDYYSCVVNEANTDNQLIANSANAAQDEFKQEVQRIQKEATDGKTKVEKN